MGTGSAALLCADQLRPSATNIAAALSLRFSLLEPAAVHCLPLLFALVPAAAPEVGPLLLEAPTLSSTASLLSGLMSVMRTVATASELTLLLVRLKDAVWSRVMSEELLRVLSDFQKGFLCWLSMLLDRAAGDIVGLLA